MRWAAHFPGMALGSTPKIFRACGFMYLAARYRP